MPDIDKELAKIEKGEAWDESDEVVLVKVKKPLEIIPTAYNVCTPNPV